MMPIEFDGPSAIKKSLCAGPVNASYQLFREKNNEKREKSAFKAGVYQAL